MSEIIIPDPREVLCGMGDLPIEGPDGILTTDPGTTNLTDVSPLPPIYTNGDVNIAPDLFIDPAPQPLPPDLSNDVVLPDGTITTPTPKPLPPTPAPVFDYNFGNVFDWIKANPGKSVLIGFLIWYLLFKKK